MPLQFEERRFILESKLHDGLVQIELHAFLHFYRIEKTEHAFADRGDFADELRIAIFEYNVPARDDHHAVGLMGLQKASQGLEAFR